MFYQIKTTRKMKATYYKKNEANSAYSTYSENGELIDNGIFNVEGLTIKREHELRALKQSYMYHNGYMLVGSTWVKR